MPNDQLADLEAKLTSALSKLDGSSTTDDEEDDDTEITPELQKEIDRPKKSTLLERIKADEAAAHARRAEAQAKEATPQRKGRRQWTEDDYRLRGFKPPSERAAEARKRVTLAVKPATFETVKAHALATGVTLGEALDDLLSS